MKNKKNTLLETGIIVFLCVFTVFMLQSFSLPIMATSDERLNYYSAKDFIETGNLNVFNTLNKDYNTCLFATEQITFKEINKTAYPAVFSGTLIFYSTVLFFTGEFGFFNLNIFFSALCAILIYLIAKKVLKSRVFAIISSVALITSPLFIKWGIDFFVTAPYVFFFLLSLWFILGSFKNKFLLAGASFSILLFIRLPEAILVFPLLVAIHYKSSKKADFVYFLTPLIIGILILLYLNQILFGSPVFVPLTARTAYPCANTGDLINSKDPIISILANVANYFIFSEDFGGAVLYHLLFILNSSFAFLILPFSFVGLALFYKKDKPFFLFMLTLLFVITLFYGHRMENYYGFGTQTLHNSFLRYLLPFFMLLTICFSLLLQFVLNRLGDKTKIIVVVLAILLLIFGIPYTVDYEKYGVTKYNDQRIGFEKDRKELLLYFSLDDIVITGEYTNKAIYPDIKNVIQYDRIFSNVYLSKEIIYSDLVTLLTKLLIDNKRVYLLVHDGIQKDEDIVNFLSLGFQLKEVKKSGPYIIYNIQLMKRGDVQ